MTITGALYCGLDRKVREELGRGSGLVRSGSSVRSGRRRLADGISRRVATMKEIDEPGAGGIRARHVPSGAVAPLVFASRVAPPRRRDRHGIGDQRAERLQDADERERDQSSNHAFNVLPHPDPSSDRRDQPRSKARLISVSAQSIASLGFEAFVTTRANMLGMM